MNLIKSLAACAALGLATVSASAIAQVVVPPQPYSDQIPSPSLDNGGLIFTLFSINPDTPYSYSYSLGLRLDDILPTAGTGMLVDGVNLVWSNLPSFQLPGTVALSDLRWHVTAADLGTNTTAFSGRIATTVDPNVVLPSLVSSTINTVTSNANNFVTSLNNVAGTPDIVTSSADPRDAGSKFGTGLNFLTFSAAGTTGQALNFYLLSSGARGANTAATATAYQSATTGSFGQWALDIANSTLTYTIAAVPLPAGVWLLLSGLAGLGVFSRRRGGAALAAA